MVSLAKQRFSIIRTSVAKKKRKSTLSDAVFDAMGSVVPSCGTALRLVETGQRRPLSLRERFVLLYNSPLCPHCQCNREKFEKERARMRDIRARQ